MNKVTCVCAICGKEFTLTKKVYNHKIKNSEVFRCKDCNILYRSSVVSMRYSNMTDDEKMKMRLERSNRMKDYFKNLSDDEKDSLSKQRSETAKKIWGNRSDEQKLEIAAKRSKSMIEYNLSLSDEDKIERSISASNRMKLYWKNMDDVERDRLRGIHKISTTERWMNCSKEDREKQGKILAKGRTEWKSALSDAEWDEYIDRLQIGHKKWIDSLTEEDRELISSNMKKYWENMSDEERKRRSIITKEWWKNAPVDWLKGVYAQRSRNMAHRMNVMSDYEKSEFVKKCISAAKNNSKLSTAFEQKFLESTLNNLYFYSKEFPTTNDGVTHCWDYAIFDENGELVMVVDLDGAYFHADVCDYDGIHSKEEYDEKRHISVSTNDNICILIIPEIDMDKGFSYMESIIACGYNNYYRSVFTELRLQPFPEPHHTDEELMKSYDKLQRMDPNDKYHQDISLNTRQGDWLVFEFHKSIWHDHRDGELSPYEAYMNDDILKGMIHNHQIYHTFINKNKILQAFNSTRIQFMSAGKAKMIISKYLMEFDEIFDPFSGYSGRMLAAISLGKKYIGQSASEIKVNESNNMVKFLRKYGITCNVVISSKNMFNSSGGYECLFTVPPTMDEVLTDVGSINKTEDELIDLCLERFKCKRYLFVVKETTKYKDHIIIEVANKSRFNNCSEKIIIMDGV